MLKEFKAFVLRGMFLIWRWQSSSAGICCDCSTPPVSNPYNYTGQTDSVNYFTSNNNGLVFVAQPGYPNYPFNNYNLILRWATGQTLDTPGVVPLLGSTPSLLNSQNGYYSVYTSVGSSVTNQIAYDYVTGAH